MGKPSNLIALGSLLYIQISTQLDISFAVSCSVQYMANLSPEHLCLTKHVLSYLLGTVDMRLCYDGAEGEGLFGYTSAKINFSYSILFHLTTPYPSYFGGKKGISRNKTSFFLLM